MTTVKLKKNMPQPSFSLIADFEGDMQKLIDTPFDPSLPAIALRNMMLFPGVVGSVTIGRPMSMNVIQQAFKKDMLIAVLSQKDADVDRPKKEDLYDQGVVAKVMRVVEMPGGNAMAILQCYGPVMLNSLKTRSNSMRAEVEAIKETIYDKDDEEFLALADACKDSVLRFLKYSEEMRSEEASFAINNITHPVFLINFICSNLQISQEDRYTLFQLHDLRERAYKLLEILNKECEFAKIKLDIKNRTSADLDRQQRDFFLQQQIKNIQNELGENGDNDDVAELEKKASTITFPPKVEATFKRELNKLKHTPTQSPDYNVQLNYLQTLLSLPWSTYSEDNLDIQNAEKVLNSNHYGMTKVKERILEHLALLRYATTTKAPIICLVGPPGVGKTSLCKSIAEALGRKYARISLGGVHDEAEIRGHRRTYIGAMPGRIIKALAKTEINNPLFVLDEIDKVSEGGNEGAPYSALLEVLDPEQNVAFHDNYLDVDYDLSQVFFIATANSLQTIPRPLLDRMEVIEVEGYLTEEKREIARRHLIPKEKRMYKFGEKANLNFTPKAVDFMIERYTRESGVRQLEKTIQKVFRKVAYLTSTSQDETMPYIGKSLKPADIEQLLGKPIFSRDKYQGNKYAGVVTGLAWTAVGGEILFIETSISRSKAAKLTLTGNLGDVMKESAVLALEYIKAHADFLNIDYRVFDYWGIHIHVPEGATPKDGPSAGITIATSIASALTQQRVRDHIAMTGEITLRGKVLPVGGIKEKILAAKRAGITDIMISEENRKDIEEIEPRYVEGVSFHFVNDVKEVLDFALLKEKVDNAIDLNAAINDDNNNASAEQRKNDNDVAVRLMKEKA